MIQTIGRAHAIKGFAGDRPLAIEPIANPALAMKKISDTTPHKIIAAMIPPPESGPCGPAASIAIPKGDKQGDKDDIGDIPAADERHPFLNAVHELSSRCPTPPLNAKPRLPPARLNRKFARA